MKRLLWLVMLMMVSCVERPVHADPSLSPSASPSSQPTARSPALRPPPEINIDPTFPGSPRRAMQILMRACAERDFAKAATVLDPSGLRRGSGTSEGAELSEKLCDVLRWHTDLNLEILSDDPAAPTGSQGVLVVDVLHVDGIDYPISLASRRAPTGELRWMISKPTMSLVRPIFDGNERRIIEERVPAGLKRTAIFGLFPWQWLGVVATLLLSLGVGWLFGGSLLRLVAKPVGKVSALWSALIQSSVGPGRLAIAAALAHLAMPYLLLPATHADLSGRVLSALFWTAAAWFALAIVNGITGRWEASVPRDDENLQETRGLVTRIRMIRRILKSAVVLVGSGFALLQFEVVRNVGVSLLASAGIAGVLVGIAAQRTLGGVIAGIELSITQPIRIGDVVVFRPGDVGTVEQIYFTYAVVRLWDERQLIVPVARIMAEPFENWTRLATHPLCVVEIPIEAQTDMAIAREAFESVASESEYFDGRVCTVEVLEVNDKSRRLRGLASVAQVHQLARMRAHLRERWPEKIAASLRATSELPISGSEASG